MQRGATFWVLTALAALFAPPALAQLDIPPALRLDGLGGGASTSDPVAISAQFTVAPDGRTGKLAVTAEVQPGWHVFSVTQKPGGPNKTSIQLGDIPGVKLAGDFQSDAAPHRKSEPLFGGLQVESHEGRVVWTAPLEFAPGLDFSKLLVAGAVRYQACDADTCLQPKRVTFEAALSGAAPPAATSSAASVETPAPAIVVPAPPAAQTPAATGKFSDSPQVTIRGSVEPKVVAPGGKVTVRLSGDPQPGWHLYGLEPRDPDLVSKPTLIVHLAPAGWKSTVPQASKKPVEKPSDVLPGEVVRYYEGPVEWTFELDVPADATAGSHELIGLIGFQVCTDSSCDLPRAARFSAPLTVGPQTEAGSQPLAFAKTSYRETAAAAVDPSRIPQVAAPPAPSPAQPGIGAAPPAFQVETLNAQSNSLWMVLLLSFVAGSLLNIMPCVLPVIGLKILGFVQQAGEHRLRILTLNLWYSAGLMAVFLALATLAVFLGHGWGQQFQSATFNIVLLSIVWVCALSFLGVWEIPIPGFAASHTANQLAMKEGPMGAFSKGILTTLLATPCAGPLLIPQLTWALGQPAVVAYAAFAAVGLGMAFPYLLIGAFPKLISWLPKPGAWMDTFKQAMGFVLLGTVAFFFSFLQQDYLVPTFILLVGLWAGCWWIGRTPFTAELSHRLAAYAVGSVLALVVGLFAFGKLDFRSAEAELAWQPFSRERLNTLLAEGKTVMVDFTADWCLTCQANKKFTYDTTATKRLLESHGVVALLADKTDEVPEIDALLGELGNPTHAIPFLAFFSGRQPQKALVVDGVVTHGTVRKAVDRVGPSVMPGNEMAAR